MSLVVSHADAVVRAHSLGGWCCLLSCLFAVGCGTSAHAFRLNPEQEPQQYRVTCKKRFYYCEREAKETCEGEYHELSRLSNRPEQPLVKDSDLSSTGPAKGRGDWEGELTVECGREVPALRLQRSTEEPAAVAPVTPATPVSPVPIQPGGAGGERVCVPGVTQACLGPGACKGAQACLDSGAGYGVCDCGSSPAGVAPDAPAEQPATQSTPVPSPTTP